MWHLLCFGYSQNGFTVFLQYLLKAYISNNANKTLVSLLENIIEYSYEGNLSGLDFVR